MLHLGISDGTENTECCFNGKIYEITNISNSTLILDQH